MRRRRIKRWELWTLGLVVLVVLMVVDYFTYIGPLAGKVYEKQKTVEALQNKYSMLLNAKKKEDKIKKEITVMEQKLHEIENTFPKGKIGYKVLFEIVKSSLGDKADLISIEQKGTVDKDYYSLINYEVVAEGDYDALYSFLKGLASAPVPLVFNSISLAKVDGIKGKGDLDIVISYPVVKQGIQVIKKEFTKKGRKKIRKIGRKK